jgi:CspA family cold shock protein
MAAFDDAQYRALLDHPNEVLEVEYKTWLDLSSNEVRQYGYCHCDERKAPGQIVALAGYQRDARVNRGTEVMQGTAKWFDFAKGYGFLVPDAGGPDVFVHITAVERAGLKLVEGLPVEYQIITARGRPAAEDLKSINGSGKSGGK